MRAVYMASGAGRDESRGNVCEQAALARLTAGFPDIPPYDSAADGVD